MENKLEYIKFEERLTFAMELLDKHFPYIDKMQKLHESCEIARTLFVRSEIQYSGKK